MYNYFNVQCRLYVCLLMSVLLSECVTVREHVCVCVCVCVSARMSTSVYICVLLCVHVCVFVCPSVSVYLCVIELGGQAFPSKSRGRGLEPQPRHTKGVKQAFVVSSLDPQP